MPPAEKRRGAFVISLDLELAWGVRDIYNIHDPYMVRVIRKKGGSQILEL